VLEAQDATDKKMELHIYAVTKSQTSDMLHKEFSKINKGRKIHGLG
jgi:hypothetical protein